MKWRPINDSEIDKEYVLVEECTSEDKQWWYRRFSDGTEQVAAMEDKERAGFFVAERVSTLRTRRKGWVIVDRAVGAPKTEAKYPPKLAGPFSDLEPALFALQMIRKGGSSKK